jgi:O-methyltransferase
MRRPVQDLLYRSRHPGFVADSVLRAMTYLWDTVSPGEFSALFRRVKPYTMCSSARLRGLYRAALYVANQNISGDLVECGCAKGGSAALMALASQQLGESRDIWLFDTFQGLPAPTADDPDYEIANLYTGDCEGPLDEVRELFERLKIADHAHFVQGLFQDTLPASQLPSIAVLHIDGDWYQSVKVCLESLYDRVTPGGIVQFDDYGYWEGARKAVDEFLLERGLAVPLRRLDYSGRFLIKPGIELKDGAALVHSENEAAS